MNCFILFAALGLCGPVHYHYIDRERNKSVAIEDQQQDKRTIDNRIRLDEVHKDLDQALKHLNHSTPDKDKGR